jgi:hypothetical protein
VTLCPNDSKSFTTAEPIQPVAPVTNTRMSKVSEFRWQRICAFALFW